MGSKAIPKPREASLSCIRWFCLYHVSGRHRGLEAGILCNFRNQFEIVFNGRQPGLKASKFLHLLLYGAKSLKLLFERKHSGVFF